MSSGVYITILLGLQAIICSKQEKCAVLDFYDLKENILSVFENEYANVAFAMNVSACSHSSTPYKIKVQTQTNNGSLEYDGTISYLRHSCSGTQQKAVSCVTPEGPAKVYRKVNRSHVAIQWEWLWRDAEFGNFTFSRKELRLNICYPPRVTSLTVDGHDANDVDVVNEGQEVRISCSFDKGNPPANFFLLDENRTKINAVRGEEQLNYSLAVRCQDEWPVIRCEGNASVQNRSANFLVRCQPQFIDNHPQVVRNETHESWKFRVKAHTTEIQKCLLSPYSLGGNKNIDLNCMLTGIPPDLLLTVLVEKEDSSKSGYWALSLYNEQGPSDLLVFRVSPSENSDACCAKEITGH